MVYCSPGPILEKNLKKMNNGSDLITNSSEETRVLGKELASKLKGGEIIALYGNLGGGKTTFVQGLAMGLGIKRRIISPTFIIIRSYKIFINKRKKNFFHLDLYRTETVDDIKGLGVDEIIDNNNNIVVIEWAEKLKDFLPKKRIDIYFEYLDENKREIKITNYE